MIGVLLVATQAVVQSKLIECDRATIDAQHVSELAAIEARLNELLEQKHEVVEKRLSIANRKVELASMDPLKRSLRSATNRNYNVRDLDALDLALQQQADAISDQGQLLSSDAAASKRKHDQTYVTCGLSDSHTSP
ncbi:hypothetical protein [Sphingomonas bacterium]|uniref:hypothetical protein n=1 Tax=Sphingomonas bacterium TaxID=1895847 RepID=UPI001575FF07|nr:hypothetical protein [Sphingomonas bacterium]